MLALKDAFQNSKMLIGGSTQSAPPPPPPASFCHLFAHGVISGELFNCLHTWAINFFKVKTGIKCAKNSVQTGDYGNEY